MTSVASLEDAHQLITKGRDTGNGYWMSCRHYPSGDCEMVALKLTSEDQLTRGGGGKRKNKDKSTMDEITLKKSAARAKTNVRRKLMSMNADRLLTLTFKENLDDINEAWRRFKYFTKLMKWRYGERWAYVAVPEYQKRGAVHFHLAITGYYHANTVRKLWHRAAGKFGGNIDITSPKKADKNSWNPRRIANYISKYITKIDSVEFNRRRYSSGGKIEVPPAMNGWLALGVPVIQVMRQAIEKITRKNIQVVWESEGFFGITYLST